MLDTIWPEDWSLRSLATFVGPRSYWIFSLLILLSEKFSGYKKFFEFVKKLAVLNDAGEEVAGKTQGPVINH
jgi:hypothetical protein